MDPLGFFKLGAIALGSQRAEKFRRWTKNRKSVQLNRAQEVLKGGRGTVNKETTVLYYLSRGGS